MTDKSTSANDKAPGDVPADTSRRQMLKAGTLAGGALLLGAPHIRNAEAAKAQTWKVQSSWDAGTTGYKLFEAWANAFEEKSGGELAIKPFPAKAVAADNNALFDAVRTGVLQAMNPFTLYWSGKIPASVFLSSYPAGPDQTSHWDTMFYGLGMLEIWPIRRSRPIQRRLVPNRPMVTGQRILDSLFPVARGGKAAPA